MTDSIALLVDASPAGADHDANARIASAVAANAPRLRAFVRRQVADLSEVEDIVQDAFVEFVSPIPRLRLPNLSTPTKNPPCERRGKFRTDQKIDRGDSQ
jgi:hypothetical protein